MSAPFGKNALTFSEVVKELRSTFETFTDRRTGKTVSYTHLTLPTNREV